VYFRESSFAGQANCLVTEGAGAGNGKAGEPGTLILRRYPALFWSGPIPVLAHGILTLPWESYVGEYQGAQVEVSFSRDGQATTLATGLEATGSQAWDTTQIANGAWEVRVGLRDRDGGLIAELAQATYINNSLHWHGGVIAQDEVWGTDRVHLVEGNLTIQSGVTVTVMPGAVVKCLDGTRITLDAGATLNAECTAESPIVFTAWTDDAAGGDTNLDGDRTKPQPGCWLGLAAEGSAVLNLSDFVERRYVRTTHSGTLVSGEVWMANQLHEVTDDTYVPSGVLLTINPGAVVKFASKKSMVVETGGELRALGSAALPITFTSDRDDAVGGDSNGDGSNTQPQPGDWRQLLVNGGVARLSYARVLYCSPDNNQGGLFIVGGIMEFDNGMVAHTLFDCARVYGGTFTARNSVFTDGSLGIAPVGGASLLVNCVFYDLATAVRWPSGTFINCVFARISQAFEEWGPAQFRHCVFYNPADVGPQSCSLTGQNGNLWADPGFREAEQGDFRLDYQSPCIDAADGTAAPTTDAMGAPRYDDPRTPNTGIAASAGAFADIGAFEFVETADSQIDLIAVDVSGPSSVVAGARATVTWKVRNLGVAAFTGAWHDRILLVPENPGPHDVALTVGEALSSGTLGPGQNKQFSAEVRVPGGTEGRWLWSVQANRAGEVFEGAKWSNNTTSASSPTDLVVPELPLDGTPVAGRFDSLGEPCWFKFTPGGGADALVTLDRDGAEGWTKLYLGDGYVPTAQDFLAMDTTWKSADVSISVAATADRTYYVMAWPGGLPSGGAGFTIKAETHAFGIRAQAAPVALSTWGGGSRVLRVDGSRFDESTTFALRGSDGNLYAPTQVVVTDSTHAELSLDAAALPPGSYDLVATRGEQSTEVQDYLTVQAEPVGQTADRVQRSLPCVGIRPSGIAFTVQAPSAIRWGGTGRVVIEYRNYTEWYVFVPLVRIACPGAAFRFVDTARFGAGWLASAVVPVTGRGSATPGRLWHGEGGSIELDITPIPGSRLISIEVYGAADLNQSLDWDAQKAELKPDFVSAEAWEPIFSNFKNGIGSTYAAVNESIASDVDYLALLGQPVDELNRLLGFELNRAGLLTIARRYALGAFGRGRPAFWELSARATADGQVTVYYGSIPWRRFDRRADGSYLGSSGDYGSLTLTGGAFRLREKDGMVVQFNGAGALDYSEDPRGNRSTFDYSGDRLTSITDSRGDVTTVEWSPGGRVTRITDAVGREVTFAYDPSGEHLESIANVQGTTRFTYTDGAAAASRHAVTAIAFPDGTHQYYQYDGQGRLTRAWRDGGQEATDYGYGSYYSIRGAVYVTPSGRGTTSIYYGVDGNLAKVVGPSRESLHVSRDADGNPTAVVGPGGAKVSLSYDGLGNVGQWEDPQGNRFTAAYDGLFSQLTALTDARGNRKSYAYDGAGNLSGIRYPGGGSEQYQYDARGNVIAWVNGRGQTVGYAYDGKDLLIQKTYPDGKVVAYDYDAHRNLTSVTDPTGVLSLQYDAADRVTRVTYPNGRYLRYEYDTAGRRTRMEDQTGFAVQYSYDALGRLAELRDGLGASIVAYTYDRAGQLLRRDRANGTYSTYAYDQSGRLNGLVHYSATNQIVSRFAYAYDPAGRPTVMFTLEGQWRYVYDQLGQLTRVLTPAGRVIQYAYDAAGNRISVTDDGVTTRYSANQDDQYTQVGGDGFSYDGDGNQTGRTGTSGSQTFGYNAENRMVSSLTAEGTLTYDYDELGNLRRTARDGVATDYLLDPFGLGDVVGEYSASGDPEARYIHGLGLEAVQRPDGARHYFSYDRMGNTTQLTDDAGTVLNSYEYLPFGETLSAVEGVGNRYRFGGEYGVMEMGQNAAYMRARAYDLGVGRFAQRDLLGLAGLDCNLYRYAGNSPVVSSDPAGTLPKRYNFLTDPMRTGLGTVIPPPPEAKASITGKDIVRWVTGGDVIKSGVEAWRDPVGQGGVGFAVGAVRFAAHELLAQVSPELENSPYSTLLIDGLPEFLFEQSAKMTWKIADLLEGGLTDGPIASGTIPVVQSCDPNDIIGPGGYGEQRWVAPQELLPYVVHFENESSASAAAQSVVITNPMAAGLELSTFELGQFGFGTHVFEIPAGLNSYATRLDLRSETGLYVDFSASLDADTGLVTWRFDSIDPVTGLATADPFAGFLPPEDGTGRGQGYVSYRVRSKADIPTGTEIRSVARIRFDLNDWIATNQRDPHDPTQGLDPAKEALVTVDADTPVSAVDPLSATTASNDFTVTWQGSNGGGSGIRGYDIYVSVDGAAYELWLADTTLTQETYHGWLGGTFRFYSVAIDNVGHREAAPATPDAETTVRYAALTVLVDGSAIDNGGPALDFGSCRRPGAGASRGLVLRNDGNVALEVVEPMAAPAPFTVTSGGSLTLPPGGEVDLTITLSPAALGRFRESLEIRSNDAANDPFVINLVGEVLPVAPADFLDELARLTYASLSAERSTDNALPWSWWSESLAGGDYCNPAEIGFYLLSHLCAYDYRADWSPTWEQAARALSATLDQLAVWQASETDTYQHALFYRGYWLNPTPRVGAGDYNHEVPSVDNAWLAASLLTLQGFCDTHPHLADAAALSAQCAAILAPMDFMAWYDPATHRFNWGGPNDPKGGTWADIYSNENRIINLVARCLARLNGSTGFAAAEFAASLAALQQTPGEYDGITVGRVAYDGSLFTYLLPAQFVREMETSYGADTIAAAVAAQVRYATNHDRVAFGVSDGFGPGDQGYLERGAPPRASGDPNNDPDDGLIVPGALGLALVSSHANRAIDVLAYLQEAFPGCFSADHGFRASVNVLSGQASNRFTALDQGMLLLALANQANGTIWRSFYASPAVAAVHAEVFGTAPADITPPYITNVDSTTPDGTYGAGANLDISVTFSETVTVTGAPSLTLETGVTDAVAVYVSGSGTSTLTFRYPVAAAEASPDLDTAGPTALALNGGSVRDAASNPADLTLPAPAAPHSLAANRALVVRTTYTVRFFAADHGRLEGAAVQTVAHGESSTAVTAVAEADYLFDHWSDDNSTDPRRVLPTVLADLDLTATFRKASLAEPEGTFVVTMGAAAVAAGDGLWDFTGHYETALGTAFLTLDITHDSRGRITGEGSLELPATPAPVTLPLVVRGSAKGTSGSVVLKLNSRGNVATARVEVTLTVALNPLTRQLTGSASVKGKVGAETLRSVVPHCVLEAPTGMVGAWTLRFVLDQAGRTVVGTAALRLSNGVTHAYVVKGKRAGTSAVLSLTGTPANPASKAIKIRATITPLEGGSARLESLSLQGYGQSLRW
jgi:RHS repeat-associated protein